MSRGKYQMTLNPHSFQSVITFPSHNRSFSLSLRSLHVDSSPGVPSVTNSYVHGTSSLPLLPLTVGQSLQTAAEKWPEREALVFLKTGIRKTFSQFQEDVSSHFSCLWSRTQQLISCSTLKIGSHFYHFPH